MIGAVPLLAQDEPVLDVLTENGFETTFSAGIPESLLVTPGWNLLPLENGSVLQGLSGGVDQITLPGAMAMADYALELDGVLESGGLALQVRADERACSGYIMSLQPDYQLATLGRFDADCAQTILASTPLEMIYGTPVTARLEVVGAELRGFLGVTELFAVTDTTQPAGMPVISLLPGFNPAEVISRVTLSRIRVANLAVAGETDTLQFYAGSRIDAMDELEALGLIPPGSWFLFAERRAFLDGMGEYYTYLGRDKPHRNIVMAATLTFTFVSDLGSYGTCGISSRVNVNNAGPFAFLDMAIDRDGSVFVGDWQPSIEEYAQGATTVDLALPPGEPHRFLMIVIENEVTVFVDGKLVVQNMPVEGRTGYYGIYLATDAARSVCEARDIWVYTFDPY
jgi:hypothetical protein